MNIICVLNQGGWNFVTCRSQNKQLEVTKGRVELSALVLQHAWLQVVHLDIRNPSLTKTEADSMSSGTHA